MAGWVVVMIVTIIVMMQSAHDRPSVTSCSLSPSLSSPYTSGDQTSHTLASHLSSQNSQGSVEDTNIKHCSLASGYTPRQAICSTHHILKIY